VRPRYIPPVEAPVSVTSGQLDSSRTSPSPHLREMELKRIIRAQADIQASFKEFLDRVTLVCKE
jgi:hypothetical protein